MTAAFGYQSVNDKRAAKNSRLSAILPGATIPFGNLVPRDIASRAAKRVDEGYGVGPLKNGVYLDFEEAINAVGRKKVIRERMATCLICTDTLQVKMPIKPQCASILPCIIPWVDFGLITT